MSLAIGLPRSVTIISSPAFTWARHALSVALSFETAVLFVMDIHSHMYATDIVQSLTESSPPLPLLVFPGFPWAP